jgi:myo-inositol 2-dehydrogenase / D-chiro-inositol 1-dehydrogenase
MKFNIALIGAGRIGAFHAQALADSDEVQIAAVVDPRPDAARAIGTEAVRCYATVDELLAEGGVDGLLLAVPTVLHRELITRLAPAGIPILSEKPCGRTAADARAIAQEVERHDAYLRVAFWRRYVPELAALRERVQRGELGELSAVLCFQWEEEPPSAALRNPGATGGLMVDCGVHDFDLLRWLAGDEVEAVRGFSSTVIAGEPLEGDYESASLALRLAGGATAVVSVGRCHPPSEVQRVWAIGTRDAEDIRYMKDVDDPAMPRAFRAQTEDFARAVRGGDGTRLATIHDAVAALEIAEAAIAEIDAGRAAQAS